MDFEPLGDGGTYVRGLNVSGFSLTIGIKSPKSPDVFGSDKYCSVLGFCSEGLEVAGSGDKRSSPNVVKISG